MEDPPPPFQKRTDAARSRGRPSRQSRSVPRGVSIVPDLCNNSEPHDVILVATDTPRFGLRLFFTPPARRAGKALASEGGVSVSSSCVVSAGTNSTRKAK